MNETFFTADLHLGHANSIRHGNRPYSCVEEMDLDMIKIYNQTVSGSDTVYILGDVFWKRHLHYLAQLKGKKILIKGNHDKASVDVYKQFTEVHDILGRQINGQYIVMCHYPFRSWNGKCHGSWHLHGHCHGRLGPNCERIMDVGWDVWKEPITFDFVKLFMENKERLGISTGE